MIIHEAARPFVSLSAFQELINDNYDNITYGYDIPYTVLKGNKVVSDILNRSELFNVQLPQKFCTKTLLEAHELARHNGDSFTEDASLLFAISGKEIKITKGTSYNIKITDPIDMMLGEIIYKSYIINRE